MRKTFASVALDLRKRDIIVELMQSGRKRLCVETYVIARMCAAMSIVVLFEIGYDTLRKTICAIYMGNSRDVDI